MSNEVWPDTPEEERVRARLLDDSIIDMKHLHRGDIFRIIPPSGAGGEMPDWYDSDLDEFFLAEDDPRPRYWLGYGWEVPTLQGPIEMLKKEGGQQ